MGNSETKLDVGEEDGLQDNDFPWFHIVTWCMEDAPAGTVLTWPGPAGVRAAAKCLTTDVNVFREKCPDKLPDDSGFSMEDDSVVFPEWGEALLEWNSELRQVRFRLVPSRMSEKVFWSRYFAGLRVAIRDVIFSSVDSEGPDMGNNAASDDAACVEASQPQLTETNAEPLLEPDPQRITLQINLISGELLVPSNSFALSDACEHLRILADHFLHNSKGDRETSEVSALTVDGIVLKDSMTIGESGLRDGSIITAVVAKADELGCMEKMFHSLIIERGGPAEALLEKQFKFPSLQEFVERHGEHSDEHEYFSVPGMYGGFKMYLKRDPDSRELTLRCESWSRLVDGSGQRHVITRKGGVKLEESGFC